MRKLLFLSLFLLNSVAHAAIVGRWLIPQSKLDYLPNPLLLRELHDGQWLSGIKKDVWVLEDNQNHHQWIQVGGYSAWDTWHGDQSWGLTVGTQLNMFSGIAGMLAKALDLASVPAEHELQYIDKALTFQAFGGYRPVNNGTEVIGHWVYGYGFQLSIPVTLCMVGFTHGVCP